MVSKARAQFQQGLALETAGDWAGAEAAYLNLLKLREQSGNFGMVAKPLLDLSRLYRHTGKLEPAWVI